MGPRWATDGDGGGDDGGRTFPSHPGPIPNTPRDNISRKGIPSLRVTVSEKDPMFWMFVNTLIVGNHQEHDQTPLGAVGN